jgi:dTMP kinase
MQQISKPYEGLFITIEGGEGCGKTTLTNRLALELEKKGYSVLKTREPGGTPLSEEIRKLLLNPEKKYEISERAELLLFLTSRAQHIEESIKPALREGKIVICERFNDSTIAYQGCARGLGMDYVAHLCAFVGEEPDFTLLLDIDPLEGMQRIQKEGKQPDRIEQEKLQFHKEVRRGFLHLADESPHRIFVLDATLPIEELMQAAMEALAPHLMIKKG